MPDALAGMGTRASAAVSGDLRAAGRRASRTPGCDPCRRGGPGRRPFAPPRPDSGASRQAASTGLPQRRRRRASCPCRRHCTFHAACGSIGHASAGRSNRSLSGGHPDSRPRGSERSPSRAWQVPSIDRASRSRDTDDRERLLEAIDPVVEREAGLNSVRSSPRPGRGVLPAPLGRERGSPAHRPAPRLAQPRGPQPRRGGDGRGDVARRRRQPPRSTSASTGAPSTS